MPETTEAETKDLALLCAHCARGLEWCSFCDEEVACPEPSCYACLAVALRLSQKRLHVHGG